MGREYMLFAFLVTRVGLGYSQLDFGTDERTQLAILEWMGASPVYTQRMQRAMGFAGGTDMATIFKGLQLDVGFCHQYMDVGYKLIDDASGEFWLESCGALLDTEPMGEDLVVSMCHHIEDPTFDATAVATNPRARIRPIHRPPRLPVDRAPHCHWTAKIDPSVEPVIEDPLTERVRTSRLASIDVVLPSDDDQGGRTDYAGDFDPAFQLEDLSHRALVAVVSEFAIQSHLLARAMLLAIADRHGREAARQLSVNMWVGANWVGSERVRRVLGVGDDAAALARVVQVHPAFPPDYAPLTVEVLDDRSVRFALDPRAPALAEGDEATWLTLLADGEVEPLIALARGVNPRAVVESAGELVWDVVIDPAATPAPEPDPVAIARVGSVAGFVFVRRRPVRA